MGNYSCDRCGEIHPNGCHGHSSRTGKGCKKKPIKGGVVCEVHGGSAPQVRNAAADRLFVRSFSFGVVPGDELADPRRGLLAAVGQSARRVALLGELLRHDYEADEGLSAALAVPGVKALIGNRYASAGGGDRVAVAEATRGLAALEAEERDRYARLCKWAIDAGLAERMVRLAEQQADLVVRVLTAAATRAGLDAVVRTSLLSAAVLELEAEDVRPALESKS